MSDVLKLPMQILPSLFFHAVLHIYEIIIFLILSIIIFLFLKYSLKQKIFTYFHLRLVKIIFLSVLVLFTGIIVYIQQYAGDAYSAEDLPFVMGSLYAVVLTGWVTLLLFAVIWKDVDLLSVQRKILPFIAIILSLISICSWTARATLIEIASTKGELCEYGVLFPRGKTSYQNSYGECLNNSARKLGDIEICKKIPKGESIFYGEPSNYYTRNACIMRIAVQTRNLKLCEMIEISDERTKRQKSTCFSEVRQAENYYQSNI